MSNDLISRSAVLDIIKKHECDTSRMMSGVIELPTAYDVDKVVERLEEEAYQHHEGSKSVDLEFAIETIRAGGVI